MSTNKQNNGSKGMDGSTTKNKGESQQSHQKGAPSVSEKKLPKHSKDNSEKGPEKNTTKKQSNSI